MDLTVQKLICCSSTWWGAATKKIAKKYLYANFRSDRLNGVGVKQEGDRFNSCQVIYSQFGLAIHQNDPQARRRFVEWAQNEIAVVPDFHKRILFSDEAHIWLNGYVNKQNCRIWSEANPQVYVETPLHPEKLTVWCALWAGGILQKR
ncbi:transposase [Trichonephila clavipes]|uniref:Transposase n=1 Tax=Trichonephila clavipes TaxID=2585209 RepID=A0A8X6WGK5_TRICX|nr:transposase [Trichonephila clavipes]